MDLTDLQELISRVFHTPQRSQDHLTGFAKLAIINKGTNNAVRCVRRKATGELFALRAPRSDSDTQSMSSAKWELRFTAMAARLCICPPLVDVWYRHKASRTLNAGLYILTTLYPYDLHRYMFNETTQYLAVRRTIGARLHAHLVHLSELSLLCYDMKPANTLVAVSDDEIDVRLIDFGRDFTELKLYGDTGGRRHDAPVLYRMRDIVRDSVDPTTQDGSSLYRQLIFLTMLVMFAAITQGAIEQRGKRIPSALYEVVHDERQQATPQMMRMLKQVLRIPELREHLKHYNGRRRAGTRHTLRLAGFGGAST